MNIGGKIKEKREKLGISQRELARRIDMSGQMISKIECGGSTPSIDTINKIAAIFNVPAASLLEDNKEDSFSYKLICAIEEVYNANSDGYSNHDIFQVLSDDLDINYADFDTFQIKRTICSKDDSGLYVYNQIANDDLDRSEELPIDDIKKLLTYYNDLDNYKFQKLYLDVFNNTIPVNAEIKKLINELVPEHQEEELKKYNISQYYKYLELRILELAANSNININKNTTMELIKNVDSLIEFELHKLKINANNSN